LHEQFEEEDGSSYAGIQQEARVGPNQKQSHQDYMQQQPHSNTQMDNMKQMQDYHLPEIASNGPGVGGMGHMTQPMNYNTLGLNMDPMAGEGAGDPMHGMMTHNSAFGGPAHLPAALHNPL
jgi:hypothetical protein